MTAIKNETTPPEAKEEPTYEELYTSDKEQACEKEIEEDEEEISCDHHANESCIEQWIQVSARLRLVNFCLQPAFKKHTHLKQHFIYIKIG